MSETVKIESKKSGLWRDAKFLWLIGSVAFVAVFEFLSLTVISHDATEHQDH